VSAIVVHVRDDVADVAGDVANRLCTAIRKNPDLVLGLPTGRTPEPVYAELRRRHAEGVVDFSRVTTFNLDEFVGVAPGQQGSFRHVMDEQLFAHVNIDPGRIGFLDGLTGNMEDECRRYEMAIGAVGGIDLLLLGIGANGHIGFNEPGEWLIASTHVASLLPATREANAALFGADSSRVPESALTMGIGTILSGREIILIAFGERKARCIEQLVNGPVTTRLPASFLQLHPRVELFLDRRAASRLT
jgi:glucosamine-6-phosphate deaminase